ncbi:phosphate ABC transporter ATP-binding protein [Limnohabitans sp. TS-CS-82]|jgi:tungstate transport system ATP-binding protein|uniref:ATP-binding cassette domain-containing protein n=1 Tax=Limnohabitans sp. TS-CS-82 TaxID=2094193 RepID=UPI000CF20498|nr:ATP-binding cassette domain-containing protein [Limnohabitans sp. TS-CS-82]PQA80531.1 phosphate ABC transporter ATP-binding protein [Limnohabitans sp. TS-CS-82]
MSAVLSLKDVSVQFDTHMALHGVNLQMKAGERVALVGANGSGKSTLLRVAHGLLKVSSGSVSVAPEVHQAMVFQRPHMLRTSVLRFVVWGLWLQGTPWREAHVRAMQALERVGLQDMAERSARTLSGGQQQRLALARAWALNPNFVLLDEPTSSLDPHAKREVERLLAEWVASSNVSLLFSSHNLGQVKRLATRVIYLEAGRVLADLSMEEFFNRPLGESHPEAHLFLKGELG